MYELNNIINLAKNIDMGNITVKTVKKWPFKMLKVGQSFIAGGYDVTLQRSLSGLISYYSNKYGTSYTCRKHKDSLQIKRTK